MAQQVKTPTAAACFPLEAQVSSPAQWSGLKDLVFPHCGIECSCGLDSVPSQEIPGNFRKIPGVKPLKTKQNKQKKTSFFFSFCLFVIIIIKIKSPNCPFLLLHLVSNQ